MDALSDVLRTTRLRGAVFLHAQFSDPWCVSVRVSPQTYAPFLRDPTEIIPYHYVLEGTLRVRVAEQPAMELARVRRSCFRATMSTFWVAICG